MPFRTFLWKNWQQYSRMRCIDGSFHQEHGRRNFSFSSRSLSLSFFLFLFLCIVRALCENEGIKACSLLTMPSSHDQVNGSWREIFYPLLYTRFAEISVFQFFFFFPSTLPFSLLCTSAVDKCYCVDTLKRALFRNFLFLCFWLSASFSLWLIFWLAGVLKRW